MAVPDKFPLFHNTLIQLSTMGLNIPQLLKSVNISPTVLSAVRPELSTQQYFAFWQAVSEQSADPLLGLKIVEGNNQVGNEFALIVMLHSSTFREALERVARYKKLSCPQIVLVETGQNDTAVFSHWRYSHQPEPPLITDMFFSAIQHTLQRSLREKPIPIRIELTRSSLPKGYAEHFGCEIRLNSPRNAIFYSNDTLDLTLKHNNPELVKLFTCSFELQGQEQDPQDVIWQIKQEISRQLNGNKPSLEQVAERLFITPRTLQRRLKELGQSYTKLLEEVRQETAERLLLRQDLNIGEVAFYLGYQEIHSFSRAFTQWNGVSPLVWRKERNI